MEIEIADAFAEHLISAGVSTPLSRDFSLTM
jgi:hypothetical protein